VRIFCYAQHLSGVGHFVRTHALAAGLAEAHEVCLVDGGRAVPGHHSSPRLSLLSLPRIQRGPVGVTAVDSRPLAEVRQARRRGLAAAIAGAPPDVLTVEHYPWSKWELEDEIVLAIEVARRTRPSVHVVCSLRDIAPRTRHEAATEVEYGCRVRDQLAAHFDAVLVHSDPRFTRLEEHFPATGSLPVPWAYTGFVCGQAPECGEAAPLGEVAGSPPAPHAVLSAGGGAEALPFLLAAVEAFRRLAARGRLGQLRLAVFPGLFMNAGAVERLRRAAGREGMVSVRSFSPDFRVWLRASRLSISRAGYNTCADLLQARVPAVLVPHPDMSDQRFRAQRMQAHGLATVALGDPPPIDILEDAIVHAYQSPRPTHAFALQGVEETRVLLERLHRTGRLTGDRSAA
jgi:predicted glycosyltransferase